MPSVLDGIQRPPSPRTIDHLGFVEPFERLGESVVVAVADAADELVRLEIWSLR